MEAVVTTGAIRRAKLHAVKLSPPTNQLPAFYTPNAHPVAQPTASEHWTENCHIPWTCSQPKLTFQNFFDHHMLLVTLGKGCQSSRLTPVTVTEATGTTPVANLLQRWFRHEGSLRVPVIRPGSWRWCWTCRRSAERAVRGRACSLPSERACACAGRSASRRFRFLRSCTAAHLRTTPCTTTTVWWVASA